MKNPKMPQDRATQAVEHACVRAIAAVPARAVVITLAVSSLLIASTQRSACSAGGITQTANREFKPVGAGVEHLRLVRGHKSETESTGPWEINLLRVDLKQVDVRIVHALDESVGLETTSSIATRYGATAAVNAGFFRTSGTYRGEAEGILEMNRKLVSDPIAGRAAVGLIKSSGGTEIFFGHLKFSGYVASNRGRRCVVNGLNRPRGADELIIYTPEFHRTTLTTPTGAEVIVRKNKITAIHDGEGSSAIPLGGFVISASGSAREWVVSNLRVGALVWFRARLLPVEREKADLWKRASYIVGGGPQLIKDGRVAIEPDEEKIAAKFVSDRHPRTAIARLKDGRMLLATVDGRQPGRSVGMSLPEFAGFLLENAVLEAINLDGGGSTTMVVNGKLVNRPSDPTGERPVSDAILILPKRLQQKHPLH